MTSTGRTVIELARRAVGDDYMQVQLALAFTTDDLADGIPVQGEKASGMAQRMKSFRRQSEKEITTL